MGTTDPVQWQLRRIGGPPTCPLVLDVFPLKEGTLTFGRNHKNDYFLDSRRLKNFISRTHAEITGYYGDDGLQFKIREKGLNGTFINDIRIQGSYILQEGDKVTFGHTNGYKIQPGEYSTQQNSEFEFMFEHVSSSSTLCNQHKLPSIQDYNDRSECIQQSSDGKDKNTTTDCFEPASPAGVAHDKILCIDKDSPQFEYEKNNHILNNKSESKTCSKNNLKHSLIDHPVIDKSQFVTEVCLDDTSDSDQQDPDEAFQNDETQVTCLSISSTSCSSVDGDSLATVSAKLQDECDPLVPAKPNLSDEKLSLQTFLCNKTNNVTDKVERQCFFDLVSEHLLKQEESSNTATLQDIQNIDHVTNRPKVANGTKYLELQHNHNTLNIEKDTSLSSIKKDQSKEIKSRTNKRKKAQPKTRQKKRRNNRSDMDSDELEDGVEWYEYETCASANCTRPKAKRVAWVQCDDCDEWYHTVCADCNYEMVKDSKMQFHCGC